MDFHTDTFIVTCELIIFKNFNLLIVSGCGLKYSVKRAFLIPGKDYTIYAISTLYILTAF